MDNCESQYLHEINKLADSISKNALGVHFYTSTIVDNDKAVRFSKRVIALSTELKEVMEKAQKLTPMEETIGKIQVANDRTYSITRSETGGH